MKKPFLLSGISITLSAILTLSISACGQQKSDSMQPESKLQSQAAPKTSEDASSKTEAQKDINSNQDYPEIEQSLTRLLNGEIKNISPSPIDGLFQVITDKGIVYSSKDGKYLLQGELFDVSSKPISITEQAMAKLRLKQLNTYEDTMINYPAKEEKYVVTVFTDIDCGYCRKLHREMQSYNDKGITIRYLAFPRGGKKSGAYSQMESIWCAENKADAMNKAKSGIKIDGKTCENPVMQHYALGNSFGVRGTPALVLSNGNMLPGYLPADKLLSALQK